MLEYLPQFIPQPVDSIHYAILIGWLAMSIALLLALAALLLDYFISFVKWIGQREERRKEAHRQIMRQVLREM
jgi:ABC-type transport system involved in cytochrome bd biosynthesis fused ATPase/permease subunit